MEPILIEYNPITGARMVQLENNTDMPKESLRAQKARTAFHNATKSKNKIVSKYIKNTKHK